MDFYKLLHLDTTATEDSIEDAFVKLYSRNSQRENKLNLLEAYQVLKDPIKKKLYDLEKTFNNQYINDLISHFESSENDFELSFVNRKNHIETGVDVICIDTKKQICPTKCKDQNGAV